jgi:molecular chaperone DnaJ
MPAPDANGRPGDAYVTVRTAEDPDFVRLGADLGREVEVTVPDAVLGATLTVPALDGDVPLVVPPGTRSGTVLRVPGRGLPEPGGRARGDLCVSVAVRIPRSLSDRERQLYGALREEAAASAPGEQPAQRPAGDGPAAGSARGRWWPWRRRRTAPR